MTAKRSNKLKSGSLNPVHGDWSQCDTMHMVCDMAGKPNEYNTNTFIQYDPMIAPNGPFMRFMNDPASKIIQYNTQSNTTHTTVRPTTPHSIIHSATHALYYTLQHVLNTSHNIPSNPSLTHPIISFPPSLPPSLTLSFSLS